MISNCLIVSSSARMTNAHASGRIGAVCDNSGGPPMNRPSIVMLLAGSMLAALAIAAAPPETSKPAAGSVVPVSDSAEEPPSAGWLPKVPVIIGDVEAGMPAAKAGLVEGDRIVSIDGQPVTSIQSMIDSLQRTKDKPLELVVDRQAT